MIPRTEENFVMTNSNAESDFRIQANAKTFNLLADKIYSYKIAAVVRELSCNAYDSMVESGKGDQPFTVTLPNPNHPYFEVEDTGLGLDDEGVRDIYTIFGLSTKTNNNDVIGAMGIGSKSPFAYSKTFTIRTRKDGVEYTYNAYLGQDGSPKINLVSKIKTDECNGVKVTVPVRHEDFNEFLTEAGHILSFFNPRPEVIYNQNFYFAFGEEVMNLTEDKFLFVDKQSYMYNSSRLYNSRIYAVMGNVCYKVSFSDLEFETRTILENISDSSTNSSQTLFLKFPLGTLDFSSSREQLSFDELTSKELNERFSSAVNRFLDDVHGEISKCKTKVDAVEKFYELFGVESSSEDIHNSYSSINKISKVVKYKNSAIYDIMNNKMRFKSLDFNYIRLNRGFFSGSKFDLCQFMTFAWFVDFRKKQYEKPKVIYFSKGSSKSGMIGLSRKCAEDFKEGCVYFKEPLSELKISRIKKLFGDSVEYIDMKVWREENKVKKIKEGKERRAVQKSTADEFYSTWRELVFFESTISSSNQHKQAILHNPEEVFWFDPSIDEEVVVGCSSHLASILGLMSVYGLIQPNSIVGSNHLFKVVAMNKRNKKYLENYPERNVLKVVIENFEKLAEIVKQTNFTRTLFKQKYVSDVGLVCIPTVPLLDLMVESGRIDVTGLIDGFYDLYKENKGREMYEMYCDMLLDKQTEVFNLIRDFMFETPRKTFEEVKNKEGVTYRDMMFSSIKSDETRDKAYKEFPLLEEFFYNFDSLNKEKKFHLELYMNAVLDYNKTTD